MNRLYEKDKAKIVEKLNKLEKQNIFKTEVERLEDGLEDLKKYHNDIQYKLKGLGKTDSGHENTIVGFNKKFNTKRELQEIENTENQVVENQGLLMEQEYIQEKLIFKMDQYKTDILT